MANETFQSSVGAGYSYIAGKAIPATHMKRAFENGLSLAGGYGTQTDVTTTGTSNNLAPATAALHQVWTGASQWTITGQVPLQNGQIQIYTNASSGQVLKFTHQDSGSTSTNRFILESSLGQYIGAGGSIGFRYDGTAGRWRVLFVEPGQGVGFPSSPILKSSGGAGAPTYASQLGIFKQYGREVFFHGRITLSNKTGLPAGTLTLENLPLTVDATYYGALVIPFFTGLATNWIWLGGYPQTSTVTCAMTGIQAAGTANGFLTVADIGNSFDIIFHGNYQIGA